MQSAASSNADTRDPAKAHFARHHSLSRNHTGTAVASPDLQAWCNSFASYLYCSRFGWEGSGMAADIRTAPFPYNMRIPL